jgi:2-methylaconitate cis-trans-isomerase PrpF
MSSTLRATFMRGGTSKGLVLRRDALPDDPAEWDELLLAAMGSPDPYGRQLNGMGGGLSSLSKVCVVGPSGHAEADVDFTFAQVQIDRSAVDYTGNCGNMSAAVGPFAVDAGLVMPGDGDVSVLVHNTNTGKLVRAGFEVRDGRAAEDGDFEIPGVAGSGAPVRLEFLDPGGAATGSLLPTQSVRDELVTPAGTFSVSMVDAGNPCVFVDASDLGKIGTERPAALEDDARFLATVEVIRTHASVAMGLTRTIAAAADRRSTPFIAVLSAPLAYEVGDGRLMEEASYDLSSRFMSNGQPHRAIPGTGALCLAVAARLPGSVAADLGGARAAGRVRVGTPAGIVPVDAVVEDGNGGSHAVSATTYRTFRTLFTGEVHV